MFGTSAANKAKLTGQFADPLCVLSTYILKECSYFISLFHAPIQFKVKIESKR